MGLLGEEVGYDVSVTAPETRDVDHGTGGQGSQALSDMAAGENGESQGRGDVGDGAVPGGDFGAGTDGRCRAAPAATATAGAPSPPKSVC